MTASDSAAAERIGRIHCTMNARNDKPFAANSMVAVSSAQLIYYFRTMVLLPAAFCIFLVPRVGAESGDDATVRPPDHPQQTVSVESIEQLRELAVQSGREGDYQAAIDSLELLLEIDPDHAGALHDLVIVLGWAERDADVLALAERLHPDATPVYVLETLAKAARNSGDFEQSAHWYEHALSHSPARLESLLGLSMVYADMGRQEQALRTLRSVALDMQQHPRVLLARAYIHRSSGDFAPAIAVYDQILRDDPDHRGALRGKIQTLQQLLLPKQALDIAAAHPGVLDEAELGRLHTDWAAVQIRWANQATTSQSATDDALNEALQEIERTKRRFGHNDAVQMRSRFDRIVALSSARRMTAAVSEFNRLDAGTESLPAYVLSAAAGAYLYLEQPQIAQQLLLTALQQEPDNFKLKHELFYVYVDLEQHQLAMQLTEDMRQSQPEWSETPGTGVAISNPLRLQAEITAGLSLAFADQLPQSQARFADLLSQAPHNMHLRHELATVFSRRGWTDRALFEYRQILAVEPDMTGARIGYAHALLDRRQFELADNAIRQLLADVPTHQGVIRLGTRWQQHNKVQYRIESGFGDSSGVQFGSRQYHIDTSVFFKPLAYRWRPFVRTADSFAQFPEGGVTRRRIGAGIEYRGIDWRGNLELNASRSGNGETGVSGSVEWLPDDYWSLAASWETESESVPLRGYRVGVDANRVGISIGYRASESRRLSVSGERLALSDGNTRHSWLLQGRQRLITRPAYKLDLDAEFYASSGSVQNVAYFSPLHDASALITVVNQWRTYRRHDFAFTQQFKLEYGYYRQHSFGASPIYALNYIANLDINAGLSLRFGLRRSRNVYDGNAEDATFYTLDLAGSF